MCFCRGRVNLCGAYRAVSETERTAPPKRGAKGAPQGAAPFRGSPQCAHWGKGSPESDTVQERKGRTHPAHSFPHWHSLSPGDPSVSLSLDSSPKRGAKGVDESRRADYYILRHAQCKNRRNLPTQPPSFPLKGLGGRAAVARGRSPTWESVPLTPH